MLKNNTNNDVDWRADFKPPRIVPHSLTMDTRTAGFTYDLLVSARPGEYEPKHRMDLHHFAIKCKKENALQYMKTYESCEVCEKL